MLEPILEEIAQEHQDSQRVARLNADENPQIAMSYDILGLPTLLLFVNGVPSDERLVGYFTKKKILAYVQEGTASLA